MLMNALQYIAAPHLPPAAGAADYRDLLKNTAKALRKASQLIKRVPFPKRQHVFGELGVVKKPNGTTILDDAAANAERLASRMYVGRSGPINYHKEAAADEAVRLLEHFNGKLSKAEELASILYEAVTGDKLQGFEHYCKKARRDAKLVEEDRRSGDWDY